MFEFVASKLKKILSKCWIFENKMSELFFLHHSNVRDPLNGNGALEICSKIKNWITWVLHRVNISIQCELESFLQIQTVLHTIWGCLHIQMKHGNNNLLGRNSLWLENVDKINYSNIVVCVFFRITFLVHVISFVI